MKVCRHFYVSGRVQGVNFRWSAYQEARRLGVTGWVRNLSDGRVEALACGEPHQLDVFADWLREGPPAARVESVVDGDAPHQPFNDFQVR